MKIRLAVAYDGKGYHGWQEQPGLRTVQGDLRRALAQLEDLPFEEVQVDGASRTDAGVHALGQVAAFIPSGKRTMWDYVRGLNGITNEDLSVVHAEFVSCDFHPRHNAAGKHYRYQLYCGRFANPLLRRTYWHIRHPLDLSAMQAAADVLVGEHDFASFRASDCQAQTTTREIWRVDILEADGGRVFMDVRGNAFLKNMVRIIAGTLIEVGFGQRSVESIAATLHAKDRSAAGRTAPAHGLTLVSIEFPDHPWQTPPAFGVFEYYE